MDAKRFSCAANEFRLFYHDNELLLSRENVVRSFRFKNFGSDVLGNFENVILCSLYEHLRPTTVINPTCEYLCKNGAVDRPFSTTCPGNAPPVRTSPVFNSEWNSPGLIYAHWLLSRGKRYFPSIV